MKKSASTILISTAFLTAFLVVPASADEASDDLNKLIGKWVATEGAWKGKALTKEQVQECKIYFTAADLRRLAPPLMSLYVPDKLVGYTIVLDRAQTKTTYVTSWKDYNLTLDPTQSPKSIKMETIVGAMGVVFLGIYEVDGDTLKVCFNMAGYRGPPKEFKSPRDSEVLFLTLKRKR